MPTMQTFRARFTDDDLAPALLFIAFAVLGCMTPAQNDTFWHLRSGQYMWQTGAFLVTEPFSHTAYGSTLHNHWWLSQLAFYLVHSLGGPFLLTMLAGSCAFAAVAGSWRLIGGRWESRIGLLVWLMVVTAGEWSIRPQVVSLAWLVLMAHLIVRDRLAWLPAVCVLWANSHAMVIFGVVMSGAVALEALVWSRAGVRRALVVAAACATAPTLSPLGWSYWPQILATVSVSRELQIQEYQMPLALKDLPFWIGLGALFILVFLARHRLRDRSPADRSLCIASFVLAIAAATASRNVAFFAVVAAPVVSRFWPADTGVTRRRARPVGAPGLAVVFAAVLIGAAVVASMWSDGGVRLGWQPLSPATIEAVRRCPDPIFNQMADGGPLMWALPDRRVFVDSRMEAYPVELLRRSRDVDLGGDHTALFREYRFGCAIVTSDSPLRERLAGDRSMLLVHTDAGRTIFVRRPAGG